MMACSGTERSSRSTEGRSASRATLLAVILKEYDSFLRETVDVGGFKAHEAMAIGADIGDTDIVAPDDEDVWLVALCPPLRQEHVKQK